MTSTEFAAKYRLLKNVASRGARSFLAQQVELRRMVMVHYLDSETPEQRASALARLRALRPPARNKLLEIAEVDGAPVAVTLFITSFTDFATWLESVSTPASPEPAASEAPVGSAANFTSIFGKVESPAPPERVVSSLSSASSTPSRDEEQDAPTIIMAPIKAAPVDAAPIAAPPAPSPSVPAAPIAPPPVEAAPRAPAPMAAAPKAPASKAPPPGDGSFTAIFGRLGDSPFSTSDLSAAPPASEPKSVLPPAAANFDSFPMFAPTKPTPQTPSPGNGQAQPGEFTQLFQRMSPAPAAAPSTPVPSFMPPGAPLGAPELPRALDPTPRADVPSANFSSAPPLPPVPSFGSPPRTDPPAILPPVPNFGASAPRDTNDVPTAPAPAPVWGTAPPPANLGSSFDAPGQSEFTRILGRVAVPLPPPPVSAQPPAPAPASSGQKGSKSLMPLWIGLAVVVLLTVAMVVYFGLRKG